MRLRPIRDRIGSRVRVLFVGINPGLRSAKTGHHFAGYSYAEMLKALRALRRELGKPARC